MHFEPYPFERLQHLLADITPSRPIRKLTIGEPQLETPESITTALKHHASELRYYPPSFGLMDVKDAMLDFIRTRFHITLTHQQIIPTFGTREVLFNFPQHYLSTFSSPIIAHPNPFYQIYEGASKASKAQTIYMPLTKENDFKPYLSDEDCEKAHLVILNSPNNPTGATLTLKELVTWVKKALKYNFVLLCDECYSEIYCLDSLDSAPTSLASYDSLAISTHPNLQASSTASSTYYATLLHKMQESSAYPPPHAPASILQASIHANNNNFTNILALNSLSKRSSAPGLRSGFIAGDSALLASYMTYRTYAGLAQPLPLARASAIAWRDEASALAIRHAYSQNLLIAKSLFPHIHIAPYSFYIWLPVADDIHFSKDLYKHTGIMVLPGQFLGREGAGRGYVRIALVYPPQMMEEILRDLADFYKQCSSHIASNDISIISKTPPAKASSKASQPHAQSTSLPSIPPLSASAHLSTPPSFIPPLSQARIHFIGIGGIGISGLAKYLHAQGAIISGSDIAHSPTTHYLRSLGVTIHIPHSKEAITNQDVIVHSAIINDDNPEIIQAHAKHIPVLSRTQALKLILDSKRVFSVCGAHGKSSISAMLSSILSDYGAIIGAESKEFLSNVREASSDTIIFEADESDKSFLNSNPYLAIVPNAEPEHMETYQHDINELQSAYMQFFTLATLRIVNDADPFLRQITIPSLHLNPATDITSIHYFLKDSMPYTRFSLRNVGEFSVWGLGEHTAQNASLAILAALESKQAESKQAESTSTACIHSATHIAPTASTTNAHSTTAQGARYLDSVAYPLEHITQVQQNIQRFLGISKRFDILSTQPLTIIDDYAHHPTEITATIQSLHIYAHLRHINTVSIIWQPHKYSRLFDNLKAFQACFHHACLGGGRLIILPVWRAGEKARDVNLHELFSAYNPIMATRIQRKANTLEIYHNESLLTTLQEGIAIGFGAGDITYQLRGVK